MCQSGVKENCTGFFLILLTLINENHYKMHRTIKLYISFILLKNPNVNDMGMVGTFEMVEIVW